MRAHHLGCLVVVVLTACAPAQPPRTRPTPQPPESIEYDAATRAGAANAALSGVRGMNYEEVLQCAREASAIDAQRASLDAEHAALTREQGTLGEASATLDAARGAVDTTSKIAVDTYNGHLEAHYAAIRAFNLAVDAYDASGSALQPRIQSYNVNCVRRPYRQSDLERLPAELRTHFGESARPFDLPVYFSDVPAAAAAAPASEAHTGR